MSQFNPFNPSSKNFEVTLSSLTFLKRPPNEGKMQNICVNKTQIVEVITLNLKSPNILQ